MDHVAAPPAFFVVASAEGYEHISPVVCLGDGQTEAEEVPSQGGRGDTLLRLCPHTRPDLTNSTDLSSRIFFETQMIKWREIDNISFSTGIIQINIKACYKCILFVIADRNQKSDA